MRKEIERLVSVMERALKNDTAVELWNVDLDKLEKIGFDFKEDFLSVNIYHLNDVYSTQYTLYSNNTITRSESYSVTKFRNKLAQDVLFALRDCLSYKRNIDKVKDVFDYYNKKFHEVYKAKYQGGEFYDLICKLER